MFEGKRIWITGATGFLGRHVAGRLPGSLVYTDRVELQDERAVRAWLLQYRPDAVVHLAYPGSRGGIQTSLSTPFDLASSLVVMDLNVIWACTHANVERLLCIGSVCSYPEHTTLPTDESQLWNGYPEPVNAAYGLAKRNQLMLLQAARQQYGLHGIHLILSNMYGPGDRTGHVIPATIRKVRQALVDGGPVVVWGRPGVTRSFLYVEDAAEGIVRALEAYDSPEPLNLCAAEETRMDHLVGEIAAQLGYGGPISFDKTQPTGHTRRLFDTTRLQTALGWTPSTPFREGLAKTIAWTLT